MDVPRQLDKRNLTFVKQLGRGGFGIVSLYHTTEDGLELTKEVAVKKLLDGHINEEDHKRLRKEAHLLWNLKCKHIIKMVGLLCSKNEFCVVMEYASNGSCFDFFRRLRRTENAWQIRRHIWRLKCRIAYEVIEGMEFLHSRSPKRILHLDLKAANILLDKDLHVKLCDFGLSQMHTLSAPSRSMSVCQTLGDKLVGTRSHIAPEHLKDLNRKPTVKSDSYSFGIFVWELHTDDVPYQNAVNKEAILEARRINHVKPSTELIPKDAPDFLKEMMLICSEEEPQKRPTFSKLKEDFREHFDDILPNVQTSVLIVLGKEVVSDTLTPDHLEISQNQEKVSRLMRSRTNDQQEGSIPVHTVEPPSVNGNTDNDYSSHAGTITRSSSSTHEAIYGIQNPMRSQTNEDGGLLHTTAEGFAEGANDSKNLQRSVEEVATEVRYTPGRLLGISHGPSHLCCSVASGNRQVLDDEAYVETKRGMSGWNECKRSPLKLVCYVGLLVFVVIVTAVITFSMLRPGFNLCEVKPLVGGKLLCSGFEKAKVQNGTICTTQCDPDREIVGAPERKCLSNGRWSASNTRCWKVCKTKPVPDDLDEINCTNKNFEGSRCSYSCKGHRNSHGPTVTTCQSNGQWSSPLPTCKCPVCRYGPWCNTTLHYSKISNQLEYLKKDNQPIQLKYGRNTITCESSVDSFFDKIINKFKCKCTDSQTLLEKRCERASRIKSCKLAAAVLMRSLISMGVYEKPCDIKDVRSWC